MNTKLKVLGTPVCPGCGLEGAEHIGCVESVNTDSQGELFNIVTCNACGYVHGVLPTTLGGSSRGSRSLSS